MMTIYLYPWEEDKIVIVAFESTSVTNKSFLILLFKNSVYVTQTSHVYMNRFQVPSNTCVIKPS